MRSDVYQTVTDRIIADLEQGELTWLKPWSAGNTVGWITRPLRHNGLSYGGINVLMLWAAAIEAGYSSACWMTFKQAQALGASVRKGEKGSMVVYAGTISREGDENDDGDGDKHRDEREVAKRYRFSKPTSSSTSGRSTDCPTTISEAGAGDRSG